MLIRVERARLGLFAFSILASLRRWNLSWTGMEAWSVDGDEDGPPGQMKTGMVEERAVRKIPLAD